MSNGDGGNFAEGVFGGGFDPFTAIALGLIRSALGLIRSGFRYFREEQARAEERARAEAERARAEAERARREEDLADLAIGVVGGAAVLAGVGVGRYLWRRRGRRAAAGRTETWNVGYDAPEFPPGPHRATTVPEDRHPQADPGPFRDWADAQASMENILRQYIARPEASAEDRTRAQALLADLRQTPPGSEWRHKVGTHAFWIALEYRDDEAA